MTKKLIAEAVGTFFLVFTVGQVVLEPGAGSLAPLAIGFVLAVMIYATGHVSGGHLNPAVTLGVHLRGGVGRNEVAGYWGAQLLGGGAAAFVVLYLKGAPAPAAADLATVPALVAEFLFTFALVFVVLNVATSRATAGNSYFGLAIGGTVLVGAYAVGSISGAAFNPAVAVGVVLMGLVQASDLWIFLVANLAGGAAAAGVYNTFDFAGEKTAVGTPADRHEPESARSKV